MLTTMTATLTATIFDETADKPAQGVRLQLYWIESHGDVLLRSGASNADGSTDTPLLDSNKISAGRYRLVMHVGDYLEEAGHANPRIFLDLLPIAFVIEDASVPVHLTIRISPQSYQVSRHAGS